VSEGAGDAEKLRALLAPLPKDEELAWEELSRRVRAIVGPRYWLRKDHEVLPGGYSVQRCRIGVRGPDETFEPRGEGIDWPMALQAFHNRVTGGAR
jgi:hypothetical protein